MREVGFKGHRAKCSTLAGLCAEPEESFSLGAPAVCFDLEDSALGDLASLEEMSFALWREASGGLFLKVEICAKHVDAIFLQLVAGTDFFTISDEI